MPGPSRFFGPLAVAAAAAATHCPRRSRDKRRGRQPVAEPHRATAHAPAVTAPASRLRRSSSRPSPSAPLASYCARPAGFPLPSLPRPAARDPLALTGRGARALLAPGPRRPRPRPPFAPAPAGGSASAARDCVADWAGGKAARDLPHHHAASAASRRGRGALASWLILLPLQRRAAPPRPAPPGLPSRRGRGGRD